MGDPLVLWNVWHDGYWCDVALFQAGYQVCPIISFLAGPNLDQYSNMGIEGGETEDGGAGREL
jgi:hypothetical protein